MNCVPAKGPVVPCTLLVINTVTWLELLIAWLTSVNKLVIHQTFRAEENWHGLHM
jgi:hypothetical protein